MLIKSALGTLYALLDFQCTLQQKVFTDLGEAHQIARAHIDQCVTALCCLLPTHAKQGALALRLQMPYHCCNGLNRS